jgi:hypothetical protein
VAISKTSNVEVRTLETEIFGACCNAGLVVYGLVLGDQDLLRLRRYQRWFLSKLNRVSYGPMARRGQLTFDLIFRELMESSSLLDESESSAAIVFTSLEDCGSEPRLCRCC